MHGNNYVVLIAENPPRESRQTKLFFSSKHKTEERKFRLKNLTLLLIAKFRERKEKKVNVDSTDGFASKVNE